jgi:hypothetical protein
MAHDNLLNAVLSDFTTAAAAYYPMLVYWAVRILATMTFAQVGLLSVQMLRRRDLAGMLQVWLYGMIRVLAIYVIMANLWEWASSIITTLTDVGQRVSGQSPNVLTPSGIYDLGLSVCGTLLKARTFALIIRPIDDLIFMALLIVVQITWLCAAMIYLWVQIEAVYLIALGPIKLCWASFDYTYPTLLAWVESLLKAGTKILTVLLVLAIGITLATTWNNYLNGLGTSLNGNRISYATLAWAESIIFCYAVWYLPRRAAQNIRVEGSGGSADIEEGVAGTMLAAGGQAVQAAGGAAITGAKAVAGGVMAARQGELGNYIRSRLL